MPDPREPRRNETESQTWSCEAATTRSPPELLTVIILPSSSPAPRPSAYRAECTLRICSSRDLPRDIAHHLRVKRPEHLTSIQALTRRPSAKRAAQIRSVLSLGVETRCQIASQSSIVHSRLSSASDHFFAVHKAFDGALRRALRVFLSRSYCVALQRCRDASTSNSAFSGRTSRGAFHEAALISSVDETLYADGTKAVFKEDAPSPEAPARAKKARSIPGRRRHSFERKTR